MSNPGQTVTLDVMIRRLEEVNARAHERVAQAEERGQREQHDGQRVADEEGYGKDRDHRRYPKHWCNIRDVTISNFSNASWNDSS